MHSLATDLLREVSGCVLPHGKSRAELGLQDDLQSLSGEGGMALHNRVSVPMSACILQMGK